MELVFFLPNTLLGSENNNDNILEPRQYSDLKRIKAAK